MRRSIHIVGAIFIASFVFSASGYSFDIPEKPQGYVNDYANILDANSKTSLDRNLYSYYTKTSNQILVVTIPSLDGGALEDISMRMAEKWKPGEKDKDNGVILLISVAEKKVRIEVGYGLEPFLTDAESFLIISNVITPEFRKGDYLQGIVKGLNAIITTISKAENSNSNPYRRSGNIKFTKKQVLSFLVFLIILIIGTFVIDIFSYRRYIQDHHIFNDNYSYGEWWLRFSLQLILLNLLFQLITMLFYIALFSGGGGRGRGGGGGFSSGGGSFGGGGASGGW